MFQTPMTFTVRSDSPYQNAQDLIAALKKDPGSLRFAISTSAGNDNHLAVLRFAEIAGVDPKKVRVIINDSGAVSITQLAGGHIEVGVLSVGIVQPLIKANQARIIGLLSDERLPGEYANIPTMREQGAWTTAGTFYALSGPKGLSKD